MNTIPPDQPPATPASSDLASKGVKIGALVVLIGGLAYCLLLAGLAQWSRDQAFQIDVANFALFAAFIVVAGAIERFLEPLGAALDFGNKGDKGPHPCKR
jgi:hypothetical protein